VSRTLGAGPWRPKPHEAAAQSEDNERNGAAVLKAGGEFLKTDFMILL